MFTDSVKVKGALQIEVFDESGKQKEQKTIDNLVVAAGKQVIAARLLGNTLPVFSHMSVGSSNTAALSSQTSLGAELARVSFDSTSRTTNALSFVATFPAGSGTGTITEAGIFNDGTSGNMLCRTNFNAVNKASGDTIVITWNVTIN
jgi:hypothetical protein